MRGRWRTGRLAGLVAVLVLGGGLGSLAGPGAASAAACAPWNGTQPAGPVIAGGLDDLNAVAVTGLCDVWMVGDEDSSSGDRSLFEHWTGGGTWTVTSPSPNVFPGDPGASNVELAGVAAASASSVWAVGGYDNSTGEHGMLLHWNGTIWAQMILPAASESLREVTAVSADDVWVTGTDPSGGLLLMHYDGTSWTRFPAPAITPGGTGNGDFQDFLLTGMTHTSASDVWLVGHFTVGFSIFADPLALHWDGSSWSQVPVPEVTPPGDELGTDLNSVSAISPADAWAVGSADEDAETVTMHWDGHTWTPVSSPNPAVDPSGKPVVNELDGVTAVSANSVWAVGGYGTEVNGVTTSEHNLVLHWDGSSWAQVTSHDSGTVINGLNGIAAGPAGVVRAAGFWGNTLFTQNRASAAVFGVVPGGILRDTPEEAADVMASAGLSSTFSTVTNANKACNGLSNGKVIASSPPAFSVTAPPVTLIECNIPQ